MCSNRGVSNNGHFENSSGPNGHSLAGTHSIHGQKYVQPKHLYEPSLVSNGDGQNYATNDLRPASRLIDEDSLTQNQFNKLFDQGISVR